MRTLLERTLTELSKDIHWTKKAVVINVYHHAMLEFDPKWNYSDTARDLELSRAFIAECCRLAAIMPNHPKMVNMSRKQALKLLRSE